MKTLSRSLIPTDFTYYRTGSRVWFEYYKKYTKLMIHRIGDGYEFIRAGRIFGSSLYSVIVEKIDTEPTRDMLKKIGIKHGIIFWGPMRIMDKPRGWFRFPRFLVQYYEYFHSTRSAFSILDQSDYWNKWTPTARAHRRKILELQKIAKLRIEQITDPNIYIDIYKNIQVPDPNKDYLIQWCTRKFALGTAETRIYIAYIDDQPFAGAIFIDEGVTSEYFTSFYSRESHPYHLGIAIMDRWFLDSYQLGIRYCDLDHMRDGFQSSGYRGYTKFKESIADHDVYFHDMWIKFF